MMDFFLLLIYCNLDIVLFDIQFFLRVDFGEFDFVDFENMDFGFEVYCYIYFGNFGLFDFFHFLCFEFVFEREFGFGLFEMDFGFY